jgi:hypothetical protein
MSMSATDLSPPVPPPTAVRPRVAPRLGVVGWLRVAAACSLLLASAGLRVWQERRIQRELLEARERPRFDLAQVPLTFGPWEGVETKIDPKIARGTGADQIVTRRYTNHDTGAVIDLILLYGPAADVYQHAPELCYPAAGFTLSAGPDDRAISSGSLNAPFRALVYSKGEGASADLQEVYYSWWYNDRWTPEIGKQKHFERIPGMFKLHLARRTAPLEKRDVGNPCESLLRELLPDLNRRMAAAHAPAA